MQNIHLTKNCISCSSHKIIWKLAYLYAKMWLDQKHKIVMKLVNLGVSKLCVSLKDISSSRKLPVKVVCLVERYIIIKKGAYLGVRKLCKSKQREKMLRFDMRQPKNCMNWKKWCNFSLWAKKNVMKIVTFI